MGSRARAEPHAHRGRVPRQVTRPGSRADDPSRSATDARGLFDPHFLARRLRRLCSRQRDSGNATGRVLLFERLNVILPDSDDLGDKRRWLARSQEQQGLGALAPRWSELTHHEAFEILAIAHEYAEAVGVSHKLATQRAANTLGDPGNCQGEAPSDRRGGEARQDCGGA